MFFLEKAEQIYLIISGAMTMSYFFKKKKFLLEIFRLYEFFLIFFKFPEMLNNTIRLVISQFIVTEQRKRVKNRKQLHILEFPALNSLHFLRTTKKLFMFRSYWESERKHNKMADNPFLNFKFYLLPSFSLYNNVQSMNELVWTLKTIF